jgi:hypothetical protein
MDEFVKGRILALRKPSLSAKRPLRIKFKKIFMVYNFILDTLFSLHYFPSPSKKIPIIFDHFSRYGIPIAGDKFTV